MYQKLPLDLHFEALSSFKQILIMSTEEEI